MLSSLRVDHIGIVVADIRRHYDTHFRHLFMEGALGPLIHDPLQKVRVAFISLPGGCLEMIEPAGTDSPIDAFLKARPAGLHHVCFGITDLETQIAHCVKAGMALASPPQPAVAFGGRRIAFLLGRDRLLWELLEDRKNEY